MTQAPALGQIKPLSQETFERFRKLIYETMNINMRESKHILVSNRLRKRILALRLDSYEEYYRLLTDSAGGKEEMAFFFDAISTNETYFYREMNHFTALEEQILPMLLERRTRIRIWSAGCSTGEEVYTLRIILEESGLTGRGTFEILATDISQEAVAQAKIGRYGPRSVRLIPESILGRYFVQSGGLHRIADTVKEGIEFRVHNLLREPPPGKSFDVLICRNVMIYFDKATQKRLVDEYFAGVLPEGGYLLIGHSESLTGVSEKFQYLKDFKSPVYQKVKE